jgi:hypothetical protein
MKPRFGRAFGNNFANKSTKPRETPRKKILQALSTNRNICESAFRTRFQVQRLFISFSNAIGGNIVQISRNSFTLLVGAAASALILSACGGGSSSTPQPLAQAALSVVPLSTTVRVLGSTTLSTSGGSGGGAVTYAVASGSCTLDGATLSVPKTAGTCTVTATKAADSTYSAATSTAVSVTVSGATLSSGFAASALTIEAGAYGGYGGSSIDNWQGANGSTTFGGGGTALIGDTGITKASQTKYYSYYVFKDTVTTTDLFAGVYVQAPGVTAISTSADTAGLDIAGKQDISFTYGQNDEWYSQTATNANNFAVILTLGKWYAFKRNPWNSHCNMKLVAVITPTASQPANPDGKRDTYTVPISSFTVLENCGDANITTPALALATSSNVSQVDFQGDFGGSAITSGTKTTSANTTVKSSNNDYPTTNALWGSITFK